VDVVWGGISLISALLQSMPEMLQIDGKWDFFINLSGSDFPIKSNGEIQRFLSTKSGYNLIEANYMDVLGEHLYSHLDNTFVECDGKQIQLHNYKKGTERSFLPMKGGFWVVLTREFCEYLVASPAVKKLYHFLKFTTMPDEKFFGTAIVNSHFKDTWLNLNTRFAISS
jgi:hypothetical protein